MNDYVVEAGPEAKELFESYIEENSGQGDIETRKAFNGETLIRLVIENAGAISASIALLAATLQGRGIKFKVSRDGIEVNVSELGKPQEK